MSPDAPLSGVRHLALDMDGTLYSGGTLFEWTRPFLDRLESLGIGHTFVTNNSSRSVREYLAKLEALGLPADESQVMTSALATIGHLRDELPEVRTLFVLGAPGLMEDFEGAGFTVVDDDPDAVIVGFDTTLNYERLCRAAWLVTQDLPYLATHPDAFCPTDQPTVLVDCGAITEAIRVATGRAPDAVLGKPEPRLLIEVIRRAGLTRPEVAMVGDRLHTDVAMAKRAGAVGVLTLTGESTRAEIPAAEFAPDAVVENVGELPALLRGG